MTKNVIETIVGFIVIAVAIGFVIIAYQSGSVDLKERKGYKISALFDRADGISVGSDIKMSGIVIGKVTDMHIDLKNFEAVIEMVVDRKYKLPEDSSAEITSNGLLGDKYIAIVPGSEEEYLTENSKIQFTQSSISIENLIGKYIFGSTSNKHNNEAKPS